jgi:hypothetical protein
MGGRWLWPEPRIARYAQSRPTSVASRGDKARQPSLILRYWYPDNHMIDSGFSGRGTHGGDWSEHGRSGSCWFSAKGRPPITHTGVGLSGVRRPDVRARHVRHGQPGSAPDRRRDRDRGRRCGGDGSHRAGQQPLDHLDPTLRRSPARGEHAKVAPGLGAGLPGILPTGPEGGAQPVASTSRGLAQRRRPRPHRLSAFRS